MSTPTPKSESLKALYWRSEILRLMYWLRGEGFGETVDAPTLERYLGVEARVGLRELDRLVTDGYVVRDGDWYALSDTGLAEGEEEYLSAFSELLRPSHGECSPECWCQMSAEEARVCAAQRERKIRDR
ncbi:MAG: hypothetical protein ABR540_09410 [Acidimicrobiales bacterium]